VRFFGLSPLWWGTRHLPFETMEGIHNDGMAVLARLHSMVNMPALAYEDNIWNSVVRRVSLAIAKAVGRQLSTRLPWGESLTTW
jgi:hypothetical protein